MAPDRLTDLSTYRRVLRQHQFTTPESVLRATRERLVLLHAHRTTIVRLVKAGDPDVLRALFADRDAVDWHVAGLSSHPGCRLLVVSRGKETLLSLVYCIGDGGDEERAAWQALKSGLAGVHS